MKELMPTAYDEVPYLTGSFSFAHPERLAGPAILRGLDPPPVETARVLELGCARGANLIPMAELLPRATFVGVDLSARQIEEGQGIAKELGIGNVELLARDVTTLDDSFGTFDYVIVHGLYSWVPPFVQQKILEVCSRNLAPNGVAFVSYSTFPGAHLTLPFREMMLYHLRKVSDPAEKLRRVRELMPFLAEAAAPRKDVWSILLEDQADFVRDAQDWYLLHDPLEEINQPVYFHQFVEQAAAHGLQYLAEEWFGSRDEILPPEVWKTLDGYGLDRIEREQYLDFIRNCRFRRSLLVKADATFRDGPTLAALKTVRFRTRVRPASPDFALDSTEEGVFVGGSGLSLSTPDPFVKTMLGALFDAWPRTLGLEEIRHALAPISRGLPGAGDDGPPVEVTARLLLMSLNAQIVSLHLVEDRIARDLPERPAASRIARYQASRKELVTNLLHQSIDLLPVDRFVLARLDGTASRRDVLRAAAPEVESGRLRIEVDGKPLPPEEAARQLPDQIDKSLSRLLAACYFLG